MEWLFEVGQGRAPKIEVAAIDGRDPKINRGLGLRTSIMKCLLIMILRP